MRGVIEQGGRAYLRAPRPSDRDPFLRLVRSSRDLHRPWVYAPAKPREFAAFLARASDTTGRCFLVCRQDDDALAGVYNLSQIARGFFESAYLGYYAFAPTAGQGLMADGLHLVLRHTFRKLKLPGLKRNTSRKTGGRSALSEGGGFATRGTRRGI